MRLMEVYIQTKNYTGWNTYFPKAIAIELNTLTGLVDYIKSSIDEMPGKMIVDVKDPETVRLYSQLDPNRDRETLVIVRARVPNFILTVLLIRKSFASICSLSLSMIRRLIERYC